MTNFSINFTNAWYLLLLIPAAFFTLFPYFRLAKRYRRTRNRIGSMVLHMVVTLLCVSILSGIYFTYDKPNMENEVILLVDASFSGDKTKKDKEKFMESVIEEGNSQFRLGIVTFGFDQVYAAKLTHETDNLMQDYAKAKQPDTSATDIAAALTYTSTLFENPETARIILLSDGIETDGNAASVIKSVAAQGIKVDTVHFYEDYDPEVQIVGVETPDYNIKTHDKFNLTVTLQSSYAEQDATLTLYDGGVEANSVQVDLIAGTQKVQIEHSFEVSFLHELSFKIESAGDNLTQNNIYNTYIYLPVFDEILIVESIENESESIKTMINASDAYNVKVVNTADVEAMPQTLDDLRKFDEVILVNVSNADMPEGFGDMLYSYVHDIGGGVFTVSGNKPNSDEANAFTRDDMYGSKYQEMLPVEVINYTPPVAVMIIIDRSGSMELTDPITGQTKLDAAKEGAISCLDALTERDWVGVMALEDNYTEEASLTPRPQKDKIIKAIDEIEIGNGTIYSGAIERAGRALNALTQVEKRHIILVTDCEPGEDASKYIYWIEENAKMGITFSIVGVGAVPEKKDLMISAVLAGGGTEDNYHDVQNIKDVPEKMRNDLEVPEIKEVNYKTFTPTIKTVSPVVSGLMNAPLPSLDGFYGSRAKEGADVILTGEYVPIYAQWKFGAGMVGSFMCDLNGTWSSEFIASETGPQLVRNIVANLFPTEDIRKKDIEVSMQEKNYSTQLSIFTSMQEKEKIEVNVTSPPAEGELEGTKQTIVPPESEGYSRTDFLVKQPGIHTVVVKKLAADGTTVISQIETFKAFSYSKEFDVFVDEEVSVAFLQELAKGGKGDMITQPAEVFEGIDKYLHITYDPRLPFLIAAIVIFLLDIAIRKFKFKWPHEIVRDYKAKKELTGNSK